MTVKIQKRYLSPRRKRHPVALPYKQDEGTQDEGTQDEGTQDEGTQDEGTRRTF